MTQQQNTQEIQFMRDSLAQAKAARKKYMEEVRAGTRKADFMLLRRLDMDIKTVENELRRVAC